MPRGVSIRSYKHGHQVIYIAFTYRGVECREPLRSTPANAAGIRYAASLRNEILRKIFSGEFDYAEFFPESSKAEAFLSPSKRITLGDLLRKREELYRHATQTGHISPATELGYRKAIAVLLKTWDSIPASDLTPASLREWISGLGITGKAVRNLLTPLRSVCEDAVADDLLQANPFDRVVLKKLLRETAKKSDYKADPFQIDERKELLDACRRDERPLVQFWFNTGLRPGEIIALAWPKIDFDKRKARIDSNVVVKTVKKPKTSAGIRNVDLNAEALDALRMAKEPQSRYERVFLNPRTGTPWEHEAQIRKTLWEPLCRRAGVRYRSPYQIRHTFISAALTAGANPWYLAEQAGHRDVEMIFRVYGRWISDNWRKPGLEGSKIAPISHDALESRADTGM